LEDQADNVRILCHKQQGHSNVIKTPAFADDMHIFSGSYDKTIKMWDTATGKGIDTS